MRQGMIVFSVILIFWFAICPVVLADNYRLNVDDQLYISVWGYPNLQQEVFIRPDGMISFPLIGEIQAEGLSINQLNKVMARRLKKYVKIKDSYVNITLKEYKKLRVMVLGEVNQPTSYVIKRGDRVLDAISLAGGTTQMADLNEVKLSRENESKVIDLEFLLNGEKQNQNYLLQDGDILHIPKSIIEVTVLGEVRQEGTYKLEDDYRLSNLIAQAGGLTDVAAQEVDYTSDGRIKKIDLSQISSYNSSQNITLHDGDTIYIPEAKYSWEKIFFIAGGLRTIKALF
ncbi:polysaccharide biosynthesis/export family protein [Selenihalanaerobacter shriftii]|uniref:Polysaccharide export outer membrane protein n=1 Tax=Selenihalanaerobacter shriftii TaxID=142842 RepID=A0A1T4KVY4_9FIRM|nr:polysaccharide biosynthesis/export family protein [Selenihalanaerobacter shriftii]SJZ46571.1 polysaccharide export outer membrane protein [Selenihalanaerobacter shriftii]